MTFWEKIYGIGKEPSPETIAKWLLDNERRRSKARRERAVKKANARRANDGASGDLTEEAPEEFEKKSKE